MSIDELIKCASCGESLSNAYVRISYVFDGEECSIFYCCCTLCFAKSELGLPPGAPRSPEYRAGKMKNKYRSLPDLELQKIYKEQERLYELAGFNSKNALDSAQMEMNWLKAEMIKRKLI